MAGASNGWQGVADRTGGGVAGLAVGAAHGGDVLFAATAVGVYCSTTGGRTWTLPATGASVPFAEAVAPSPGFGQDRTIFVCAADGLYRSADAGETWQQVLVGSRMLSAAVALGDGYKGLVVLAGTETDGVLRSVDGGRTWTGANAGLLDLTVIALALSPAFGSDRIGFAGTASGLYRTRNGGSSWREVETGLADPAVQCIVVSPAFAEDRLVLAGTEVDGLLRSDDAGATWTVPAALAGRCVTALAFSPQYPRRRTIAAATDVGIALSHDGGLTWQPTDAPPAEVLSLICAADGDGEALLAGLHRRGVVRSDSDGARWTPANDGLRANLVVGLALSPALADDQTLFTAGLQDGISVSRDGGRTWAVSVGWPVEAAALGLAISPAFARDRTVYAATAAGVLVSRDAGMGWQRSTTTAAPLRAIVAAPAANGAPPTVLAALLGGELRVSEDAGRSWRVLSASADAPALTTRAFGAGEILALVVSLDFARDGIIFIATALPGPAAAAPAGGLVLWRSTNGGERWQRWLVEVGRYDLVSVAVSPSYAIDELVFVGLGGRVLKPLPHAREVRAHERRPIWRGADVGDGTAAVTALAVSPGFAADHTVFAATSAGVFVSRDAGDTFNAWSEGLEHPPRTLALAVSPSYVADGLVYALGLGGTLWRRRDQPRRPPETTRSGSG